MTRSWVKKSTRTFTLCSPFLLMAAAAAVLTEISFIVVKTGEDVADHHRLNMTGQDCWHYEFPRSDTVVYAGFWGTIFPTAAFVMGLVIKCHLTLRRLWLLLFFSVLSIVSFLSLVVVNIVLVINNSKESCEEAFDSCKNITSVGFIEDCNECNVRCNFDHEESENVYLIELSFGLMGFVSSGCISAITLKATKHFDDNNNSDHRFVATFEQENRRMRRVQSRVSQQGGVARTVTSSSSRPGQLARTFSRQDSYPATLLK